MGISPVAGRPVRKGMLVDVARREGEYYVTASPLAGEPITAKLTRAPGNDAAIRGLKGVAASGWLAARPSGTEDIYKIYAESFQDQSHLDAIVSEAQELVQSALRAKPDLHHE